MMGRCAAVCAAIASATFGWSATAAERPIEIYHESPDRCTVAARYIGYVEQTFRIGRWKDVDWDDGYRVELAAWAHTISFESIDPVIGAYAYYDLRERETSASRLESESYGGGGEVAAVWMFYGRHQRGFRVGLMPWLRGGGGGHELEVRGQPGNIGRIVGLRDAMRLELAGGVDALMLINRTVEIAIGAGYQYWTSGSMVVQTGASSSTRQDMEFHGDDLFLRASIGWRF
mgnify:CR=1 FL=1